MEPNSAASAERFVETLIPSTFHEGFVERRADFIDQTRERIIGTIATMGGLEGDSPTAMRDRVEAVYSKHMADITLFAAVKSLDVYFHNQDWQYEGERKELHQEAVMGDVLEALTNGHRAGHNELATSIGKTYIQSKLAEAFAAGGLRVLMLGHTKTNCDLLIGDRSQDKKGLAAFAPGIDTNKVGRHYGGGKAKKTDQIVVSTYQSMNRFAASGELGEFDIVLADEAHRGLGEITSKNLEEFSSHAVKIGATATPDFGVNKSVSQIFPEKFHKIDIREAIERRLASTVQCLTFATGNELQIKDPNHQDFTPRELRRLINLKSRNEKALQFAHDFVQEGRQGIIACVPGADMAHTKLMAEQLSTKVITDAKTGESRNIIAKAVGAFLPDAEVRQILQDYEAGHVDVLTFVGILAESWDSQKASFLINTCPTTSIVKLTQQIGRVLRLKDTHAIVVDFIDDIVGKQQVTALHVLGEETITLNKIYGSRHATGEGGVSHNYLRGILSQDLYRQLMALDNTLLTDLYIPGGRKQRTRSAEYYERILQKEGLYEDTHPAGMPPQLLEAVLEIEESQEYQDAQQVSAFEALQHMAQQLSDRKLIRGPYWARATEVLRARHIEPAGLLMDTLFDDREFELEAIYDNGNDEEWDPEFRGMKSSKAEEVERLISGLDERQQEILRLKYGLSKPDEQILETVERFHTRWSGRDAERLSNEDLGEYFNLTRSRINQLEHGGIRKVLDSIIDRLPEDIKADVLAHYENLMTDHGTKAQQSLSPNDPRRVRDLQRALGNDSSILDSEYLEPGPKKTKPTLTFNWDIPLRFDRNATERALHKKMGQIEYFDQMLEAFRSSIDTYIQPSLLSLQWHTNNMFEGTRYANDWQTRIEFLEWLSMRAVSLPNEYHFMHGDSYEVTAKVARRIEVNFNYYFRYVKPKLDAEKAVAESAADQADL